MKHKKHVEAKWAIEQLEPRRLLSTYTVTTAADAGAGSLRQAILDANAHAGADTIAFAIGSGAKTISPSSHLPGIGDNTILDATTQPGYAGKPLITLNGSNAGPTSDGLKITGTGVTIRGFIITNFAVSGIFVFGAGSNTIAGNYIGTDGSAAAGNHQHGIIVQSPNNTIGGLAARDRNVISANANTGVFLYTAAAHNNTVIGNFIGADATGSLALGNARNGVQIDGGHDNFIGGSVSGSRNIISANARDGVLIINAGANLHVVQGNYIGADVTGTRRLGNAWYGIEISRENNVIGGSTRGAGNVVSANGYGGIVMFLATAFGNRVQGNFIGTDVTGTKDLGNTGRGVEFTNGAHDNRVGGELPSARNVISGNDKGGVGIYSGAKMNLLQKNYIGTTADGSSALGNTGAGVMVTAAAGANFIGGRRLGNVIAANTAEGVCLTGGTAGCIVQGNYIGTDVTGTKDLGNATDGIFAASSQNQLGGRLSGTGNLIAANNGDGIRINQSHGNLIARNIVGQSATGAAMGNAKNGVLLMYTNDSPVRENTIANNGENGVRVLSGSRNTIILNSIYANAGEGISLSTNAAGPTITSVKTIAGLTTIAGAATGVANTSLYLEFFCDGGKTMLGSTTATTDGSGRATFSLLCTQLATGTSVCGTVTAADGTTSEFSTSMKAG